MSVLACDELAGCCFASHAVQQLEGLPIDEPAKRTSALRHPARKKRAYCVHQPLFELCIRALLDTLRDQCNWRRECNSNQLMVRQGRHRFGEMISECPPSEEIHLE